MSLSELFAEVESSKGRGGGWGGKSKLRKHANLSVCPEHFLGVVVEVELVALYLFESVLVV